MFALLVLCFFALLRWAVVQFAILMRSVRGMLILLLNHVGGGDRYCAPSHSDLLLRVRLLIDLDTTYTCETGGVASVLEQH